MKNDYKRLMQAAREMKGWDTPADVGAGLTSGGYEVSAQTLTNWKARGVSKEGRLNASRIIGCRPHWVETGEGPMKDYKEITGTTDTGYAVNVEPTDAERQQYPLISWVQAGAWREIVDAYPRGWGESMVFAQNQHGGLTFALKVMGDSMEPEFREGDVIFVDPDKEPKAGSYVVAKNHEEEATFKKYRSRGKDAEGNEVFELVPLNENYATLRSDQEPITIIGVVVEHTRVFKV